MIIFCNLWFQISCFLPISLFSTLFYSTVLYSILLYSTLLYSTLLYSELLYSALLYSALLRFAQLCFNFFWTNLLFLIPLYHTVFCALQLPKLLCVTFSVLLIIKIFFSQWPIQDLPSVLFLPKSNAICSLFCRGKGMISLSPREKM